MIGDKRGLSTIIVTLIIIGISLISVGIVWVVVRNLIGSQTGTIEITSKCLNTYVDATAINCTSVGTNVPSRICDVSFMRTGAGSDVIGGIKLVFRNTTAQTSSNLITVSGNIEPLVGLRKTGINTTLGGVNKLETTVFFTDDSGNGQTCLQTSPFTF